MKYIFKRTDWRPGLTQEAIQSPRDGSSTGGAHRVQGGQDGCRDAFVCLFFGFISLTACDTVQGPESTDTHRNLLSSVEIKTISV